MQSFNEDEQDEEWLQVRRIDWKNHWNQRKSPVYQEFNSILKDKNCGLVRQILNFHKLGHWYSVIDFGEEKIARMMDAVTSTWTHRNRVYSTVENDRDLVVKDITRIMGDEVIFYWKNFKSGDELKNRYFAFELEWEKHEASLRLNMRLKEFFPENPYKSLKMGRRSPNCSSHFGE